MLRIGTVESFVIGVLGTAVGLGVGWLLLDWLVTRLLPQTFPDIGIVTAVSGRTWLTAVLLGVLAVTIAPLFTTRKLRRMDIPSTSRDGVGERPSRAARRGRGPRSTGVNGSGPLDAVGAEDVGKLARVEGTELDAGHGECERVRCVPVPVEVHRHVLRHRGRTRVRPEGAGRPVGVVRRGHLGRRRAEGVGRHPDEEPPGPARSGLVEPAGVGLFEEPPGARDVARAFLVGLEVPLGALDRRRSRRRRRAAATANSRRELATEWMTSSPRTSTSPAGSSLPPADSRPAGRAAVEGVVLLAAVHADDGPHPVLVGIQGHARRPGHAEDREIGGVVERGDAAELDGSERLLERSRVGDELVEHVADGERRCVLVECRSGTGR